MGLRSWIQSKRYGGQTGLNEMGNNARMTGIIAGPFLVGWLFVQMFVPLPYVEVGILVLFGCWVSYCVWIYAYARADASGYRAFPQSVWRFPDGGVRVFNMLIPPDGFEHVCDFKDGSKGYHVIFADRYQYHEGGMPFPHVFNGAWFKIPAEWDKAFTFKSAGEFFHKGIAIDHPACENISVYVVAWDVKEGKIEPICLINDCSLQYKNMMENSKKVQIGEIKRANRFQMLYVREKKAHMGVLQHSSQLEDSIEVYMKKGAPDQKKQVDGVLSAIRGCVHTIMDTSEPLLKRIFSFKNIMKGLFILLIFLLITHFFFGWPF